MADLKKRITSLTEKTTLTSGDFIAVDNDSGGTKKYNYYADKTALDQAVEDIETIEGDVADLKDDLSSVVDTVYDSELLSIRTLFSDFAPGGLNGIDYNPGQAFRCTNKSIHETTEAITVYVADGFRVGWSTCDSSGTFIAWSTWYATVATIPANTRFRMQIARISEITSEIADVVTFTDAIRLQKSGFNTLKTEQLFDSVEFDITKNKVWWDKKTFSASPDRGYVGSANTLAFMMDIALDDYTEIVVNNPQSYRINIATLNSEKTEITTAGTWKTAKKQSYTFFASDKVLLAMIRKADSSDITSFNILNDVSIVIKNNNEKYRRYVSDRVLPIEKTKYSVPWHIGEMNGATGANHLDYLNASYSIVSDDIIFDEPMVARLTSYSDRHLGIYPIDDTTGYYQHYWSGWLETDYYLVAGKKYRINVGLKNTSAVLTETYGDLFDSLILEPLNDVRKKGHWTNVCHRGYTRTEEIENTISSLIEAYKAGYKYCECDVRITSDGYPVLAHDGSLTGTVNGQTVTYTIADTPLATLQQLVLKESVRYGTIHPPTWEEYLECASLLGMSLVVDLYGNSQYRANIEKIVNSALKYNMDSKVLYTPNDTTVAGYILALDEKARIRFYATDDYTAIKALMNGENEMIAIITLTGDYANPESVLAARQAGLTIYIWNIDSTNYTTAYSLFPDYAENESYQQSIDYGAEYIANQGY